MRSAFTPTSPSNFATQSAASGPASRRPPADPETARLFAELRRYLGLSIPDIAHRIAAQPDTVWALEQGRLDLLPQWSETARIATAYIALAGLDPRPALNRLSLLLGAAVDATPHRPHHAAPAPGAPGTEPRHSAARLIDRLSSAAARAVEQSQEPGVLAEWGLHVKETVAGLAATVRSVRAPVRWVSAAALGLIILGSAAPSAVLQASVGGISEPISGLWRKLSGVDANVRVIVRDGLKWIEADDPRERRSDKLPSRRS